MFEKILLICQKEIDLGLKFVPSANKIDQAKLKRERELEEYGSRSKSFFNPRNKDTIIETYLSCLEERLLDIEIPSKRQNNLTKEERDTLYSWRDSTLTIKGADKGSIVVVWDKEDYLKEAYKQLRIRKCTKRSRMTQMS